MSRLTPARSVALAAALLPLASLACPRSAFAQAAAAPGSLRPVLDERATTCRRSRRTPQRPYSAAVNQTLLRAVAPLLTGIGLLISASALQFSLLAVRADGEGFAEWVVPVMSACYFAAFLVGSWLAPRWIDSVGHVRTFSAMASLASVVILSLVWLARS